VTATRPARRAGAGGDELAARGGPAPARVVHIAQVAVLSGQAGGAAVAVAAVRSRALFSDLADVSCAAPGELLPGDGGDGGGGEGQAAGRAQKAQRTSRIFTVRPHLIG
jgi:hypothetical protein